MRPRKRYQTTEEVDAEIRRIRTRMRVIVVVGISVQIALLTKEAFDGKLLEGLVLTAASLFLCWVHWKVVGP
jgi:hypothetical protein